MQLREVGMVRQVVKRCMQSLLPRSAFMVRGPRTSRRVCLTFDDGPHPVHTPRLLDALAEHGVRATFFLVGERAAAHPDVVRRMAAEGHVIGHHSYHHRRPEHTGATQLTKEVVRTLEVVERLTGTLPKLFRPPHGKLSAAKLARLWALGQTVVLWSADPRDYARASADEVMRWFEDQPASAGDIVLLHDTLPYAGIALGELTRHVRARGLELGTVDTWT